MDFLDGWQRELLEETERHKIELEIGNLKIQNDFLLQQNIDLSIENNDLKSHIEKLSKPKLKETNIFDKETIIENATVQILENTVTGEISIGWWKNE